MDRGGDVTVDQFQSIITIDRMRLIGEPEFVERAVQPVAGAISSKYSARTIAAVCCRRQTDNQEPCLNGAEAWNRTSPVLPITKSTDFFARYLFAVLDKPLAACAIDDVSLGGWE